MLLHQKLLRDKLRKLLFFTFIVGVSFLSVFAATSFSWVTAKGSDHAKMVNDMLLYTKVVETEAEIIVPDEYTRKIVEDPRTNKTFTKKVSAVRKFFTKYNAPLAKNSEDFVRAADMYGIDYRLLPSIAMIESGGGKVLFRSNNPFGWGKSGFPSFKAAIYEVSRGMSSYYKGGLKQPERIAYRYNPVTPESWGKKCRSFMNQMPAL